jgi:hypothetical protein
VTSEVETLITPAILEKKGRWNPPRVAPPIAASDIRRWAIATYWPAPPPPIYWDEAYARGTRWGGIIAPPDFNPFAWPVERRAEPAAPEPLAGARLARMNGGQSDTYGVPMRPGDVISARTRLSDVSERRGRLGLTLYLVREAEWTNQEGALVRRRLITLIRYPRSAP